jgi:hypothetical protein
MGDEQTSQQQGVTIPPVEQDDPTRNESVQLVGLDTVDALDDAHERHVLDVVRQCAELEQFMTCRALTWDELMGRDLFKKVLAVLRS